MTVPLSFLVCGHLTLESEAFSAEKGLCFREGATYYRVTAYRRRGRGSQLNDITETWTFITWGGGHHWASLPALTFFTGYEVHEGRSAGRRRGEARTRDTRQGCARELDSGTVGRGLQAAQPVRLLRLRPRSQHRWSVLAPPQHLTPWTSFS